jgi:hypothetical protein
VKIVTQVNWMGLYQAIDEDSYDGAPDSKTRNQVGIGSTPERAIADLMAEIEFDQERA